jgi:hypothetical protein
MRNGVARHCTAEESTRPFPPVRSRRRTGGKSPESSRWEIPPPKRLSRPRRGRRKRRAGAHAVAQSRSFSFVSRFGEFGGADPEKRARRSEAPRCAILSALHKVYHKQLKQACSRRWSRSRTRFSGSVRIGASLLAEFGAQEARYGLFLIGAVVTVHDTCSAERVAEQRPVTRSPKQRSHE